MEIDLTPATTLAEKTLEEKRLELIEALRSGRFKKGTGGLSMEPYTNEESASFCCIGVGCSVLGVSDEKLLEDSSHDYLFFERQYRISNRMARYLMAMNDGGGLKTSEDNYGQTYGFEGKVIRSAYAPSRKFSEIARFLEIVWKLTPQAI